MKIRQIILLLLSLTLTNCVQSQKSTKDHKPTLEDQLTKSQLDEMKELKGYKLGTKNNPKAGSTDVFYLMNPLKTTVGGLDGVIHVYRTRNGLVYKIEFISNDHMDKGGKFVKAVKNRYSIPLIDSRGYKTGESFSWTIDGVEYDMKHSGSSESIYLRVSEFTMTDLKLEKRLKGEKQEKANSDF